MFGKSQQRLVMNPGKGRTCTKMTLAGLAGIAYQSEEGCEGRGRETERTERQRERERERERVQKSEDNSVGAFHNTNAASISSLEKATSTRLLVKQSQTQAGCDCNSCSTRFARSLPPPFPEFLSGCHRSKSLRLAPARSAAVRP